MDQNSANHVLDADLLRYAVGKLAPAEAEVVERHILSCSECTARLETVARSAARDRRSEPRSPVSGTGILRSFSPLLPERWRVELIDVSNNGIGLLVPIRLQVGVLVQLRFGGRVALGEVRYSKQIADGRVRTGIRLYDVKP